MSWTTALFLLASALAADAHIAMWHKSMFGLNAPGPAEGWQNYNANVQITPLRQYDNLEVKDWFGHGYTHLPPAAGDFLELPAGGDLTAELSCNKAYTTLRDPRIADQPMRDMACDDIGPLHVMNHLGDPNPDPSLFGGTSLAIAYTSDVDALKPTDMTVISVHYRSVWKRETVYSIPADLGECPEGGCICTWNWIHQANKGEGYGPEIYNVMFRCKVTGATTGNTLPLGGATVPTLCENNAASCVTGPKQPMYVYQKSGNNMEDTREPPSYNKRYGFEDGAQNDLFPNGSTPKASSGATSASASASSAGSSNTPSATTTQLGVNAVATGTSAIPASASAPATPASASVSASASTGMPSASGSSKKICKRRKRNAKKRMMF